MWPILLLLLGHKFLHPKIVRIGLKANTAIVSMTYDVDPGPTASKLRQLFDRDTSGHLEEEEQARLTNYLEQMAMLHFSMKADGEPLPLEKTSATAHRLGLPVSATDTLGISLLYRGPIRGDSVKIHLSDRTKDPTQHVPVDVDLADGWNVRFASQGALHPGPPPVLRQVRLGPKRPLVLRVVRRLP